MTAQQMIGPRHAELLRTRAVAPAVVEARGYRTVTDPKELRRLGFSPKQAAAAPGLLIPRWTLAGKPATYPQFRPDQPRRLGDHLAKYELPAGSYTTVDVLPLALEALRRGADCWVSCEGHIKSDALLSAEVPAAAAIVGVWAWKTENTVLAWKALVDTSPSRWFHLVADSDFATTVDVGQAVSRFAMHLTELGARARVLHPPSDNVGKVGVDDHLAAGGRLEELVEVDRAELEEAAGRVRGRRAYPALAGTSRPRIRFISGREGL